MQVYFCVVRTITCDRSRSIMLQSNIFFYIFPYFFKLYVWFFLFWILLSFFKGITASFDFIHFCTWNYLTHRHGNNESIRKNIRFSCFISHIWVKLQNPMVKIRDDLFFTLFIFFARTRSGRWWSPTGRTGCTCTRTFLVIIQTPFEVRRNFC